MPWKVTKCCFCLPLRQGLLGFGYIKLVTTYAVLVIMICLVDDIFQSRSKWNPINSILLSLALASSIIDFLYNIIMLLGLHKGTLRLMDYYFGYCLFVLATQMIGTAFLLPLLTHRRASISLHEAVKLFFIMLMISCIMLTIQIYYVILVRSMVSVLKANKRKKDNNALQQKIKGLNLNRSVINIDSQQDTTNIVLDKTELNMSQDKKDAILSETVIDIESQQYLIDDPINKADLKDDKNDINVNKDLEMNIKEKEYFIDSRREIDTESKQYNVANATTEKEEQKIKLHEDLCEKQN